MWYCRVYGQRATCREQREPGLGPLGSDAPGAAEPSRHSGARAPRHLLSRPDGSPAANVCMDDAYLRGTACSVLKRLAQYVLRSPGCLYAGIEGHTIRGQEATHGHIRGKCGISPTNVVRQW